MLRSVLARKNARRGVISGLLMLGLMMDFFIMNTSVGQTEVPVWKTAGIWVSDFDYNPLICLIFILLVCVNVAASLVGTACALQDKQIRLWPFVVAGSTHAIKLFLNYTFDVLPGGAWLMWLGIVLAVLGVLYVAFLVADGNGTSFALSHARKWGLSAVAIANLIITLSLFFVPFCTYIVNEVREAIVPIGVFSRGKDNIFCMVLFIILGVVNALLFYLLIRCFRMLQSNDDEYADAVGWIVLLGTLFTAVYFFASVVYCSLETSIGWVCVATPLAPLVLTTVLAICYALMARKLSKAPRSKKTTRAKIELFVYAVLMAAITIVSCLSDIITVKFSLPISDLHLNGWDIFTQYNSMEAGFQLIAFLLFCILAVTIGLCVLSLVSLIGRSKFFGKIALAQIVSGITFCLLIGLFGKYYEIVQGLNESMLRMFFGKLLDIANVEFEYVVTGQSFYWFIASLVLATVVLLRKPYTRSGMDDMPLVVHPTPAPEREQPTETPSKQRKPSAEPQQQQPDSDPCPAFTELDAKAKAFENATKQARQATFDEPTLQKLVQFVVEYARDSRLHLSYTAQDIATFVAGLGATRLSILQGMSGTGKTSLPKIFAEAIMGRCEIVEVESSWRDKNELLGYYNEFSRMYTPKKFTQALYRAVLNPEIVTFIVLDEMNLSRIEYYFSDFLSLMEHEEDKREIKLLNIALSRVEKGKTHSYRGLTEGHTLKIPNNIWFIGTANRDESTFEISDKVYDRAHTMNFNKRAPKVLSYGEEKAPQYFSVGAFLNLLKQACATNVLDVENCELIQNVERLLADYNISFGNRIAKQIENFVSIYCACFPSSEQVLYEAIETILLSKVVSKLEVKSVENKTQLASEFEKLNLRKCSQFILKLNED